MQYTRLGARGPEVSTVGFGAWAIGGMNWGKTDDAESKKALHAALDRGVTLIDTADVYGFGHFCISHPACHTAIPGAKTQIQVLENCAASDYGPIPEEWIPELVE